MIDPDIEACHELRYVLKMGRVEENHEEGKTQKFEALLECRGWWQQEGSRANLKNLTQKVS